MVPDAGSWNYAFSGVKWSAGMKYGLKLSNPKAFFDGECSQPGLFSSHCGISSAAVLGRFPGQPGRDCLPSSPHPTITDNS